MDKFVAFPLPDGSYFQVRHLPWDVVEEIEKKHGISWLIICDAPQINGGVLADLAREVAIANDLPVPEINTPADLIEVSDRLVVVDGDGRRVAVEDEEATAPPLMWSAP